MMKNFQLLYVCLSAAVLLYWYPLQHGHCSEQNDPDLQNQPQIPQDFTEQADEIKEEQRKDKAASQDSPPLYTTEQSTQTDTGPVDELQTHESEVQKKNKKDLKVDETTAEPALTPEVLALRQSPDNTDAESSSPPEQNTGSPTTDLSPLPVAPVTQQDSPTSALLHSTTTALPGPACIVAGDSCTSTSVTAVPSTTVAPTGACNAGESTPSDTDLASYDSLPVVLEGSGTSETEKGTKGSLEKGSPGTNTTSMLKEQTVNVTPETDPPVPGKDPEDIPTFDEWKKIMMEVENEKSQTTHTSCNGGSSSVKKVQKTTNYASVECGAKILASNPEAKSTSAILMENMDVYMLNPCSNKIWFVIELCQPIQVKQLDIANFELFSSTPKDFLVSISDRYPTNKWAKLGTFHARDERTIQSFPLDEHLYAKYVKMFTKYIKVELLSHFGSEHFCPLSLIRVFGTSMMEEYELNSEPSERTSQDEEYDYLAGYMPSDDKSSKNLIGSAKDAIINMVNNIAANVLGGDQEDAVRSGGNHSSPDLNLTETSGAPQTVAATSSVVILETLEEDENHMIEITETADITQDRDTSQVTPSPTASLSETPSITLAEKVSLSSTAPVEELIVTLLPKEEEEEGPEKSSSSVLQEVEHKVEEEQDEHYLEVQESVSRCGPTPHSCSCVASPEEYLLQKCFSLHVIKKKKSGTKSQEEKPSLKTEEEETQDSVPAMIPSSHTQSLNNQMLETSSLLEASNLQEVVPPLPENEIRPGAGSLDFAPSLTSALPKPTFTDTPASKATHAVDFLDPSVVELPGKKLPDQEISSDEPSEIRRTPLLTSHSESACTPVLTTTSDTGHQEQKPPSAVEKSTTDMDSQNSSVTNTTRDQPPVPPLSIPADQSSLPTKTKPAAAAAVTATATPVTETSEAANTAADPKSEELLEEVANGHFGTPSNGLSGQPSSSEFYAEMHSTTDTPMHGSNQKESVFMRLNNRIKALEVNMSLSGRYLEQLSQRYRKQMEEMQKAFNKTIIKLQNTSRIAEEQDQKQTESIQVLQGQLENVTQLVLNLSVRVSQLQREVSDRHSYLLLCLVLCGLLGLVVFINFCRMSTESPSIQPDTSIPTTYSYCCPDSFRASSDGGGESPKRRASFPLPKSSLQIPTTEGPNEAYNVETRRNSTGNKKKKRCKMKCDKEPETVTPTLLHTISSVPNGALPCNSRPSRDLDANLPHDCPGALPLSFRDPPSEGSSEGSSHSDDPSFCGIANCRRFCEGLPPPKTRSEKRAFKRRRSKPSCAVVAQLLQPVQCNGPPVGPAPPLQGLIRDSPGIGLDRAGVTTIPGLS